MCVCGGKERRKARLIGFDDSISYRRLIAVPLDSTLAPLIAAAAAVPRGAETSSFWGASVRRAVSKPGIGGPTERQPHTNFVRYRSDTTRADNMPNES